MSCCQGSRPSLRTQTYLQWICWAACAVRLSPLRATSAFLMVGGLGGWKDRGRKGELRGRRRGGWSREGREGAPAKSLSYMENTSGLQGNRTTSEFSTNKNSSDVWRRPLCSLAPVALSASVTFEFPPEDGAHVQQSDFICRGLEETTQWRNLIIAWSRAYLSFLLWPWMETTSWWPIVWTSVEVPLVNHFII